MKTTQLGIVAVGLFCFLGTVQSAMADTFKSAKECVVGKRVVDSNGRSGTITHVEANGGTMCTMIWDENKQEHSYIFWMLRGEGANKSAEKTPVKTAAGEDFRSAKECAVGRRVMDSNGKSGTVTHLEANGGTLCTVLMDENKKEHAYIFWMLHAEGASRATYDKDKLTPGVYECFAGGHYTFMDMRILSANSYESGNEKGKFRVEPSGTIVFESGPFVKNHGKLMRGPAIGLNADGGTFYATTCEYNKNKK